MFETILIILACVFVVEGFMPFIAPKMWQNKMLEMAKLSEGQIRTFGMGLIIAGVVILGVSSLI